MGKIVDSCYLNYFTKTRVLVPEHLPALAVACKVGEAKEGCPFDKIVQSSKATNLDDSTYQNNKLTVVNNLLKK